MILEELGRNIKKIRKTKGWTLNYAAKKAMLNCSHLKRIETGKCNFTIRVAFRISQCWNVPIIHILKGSQKS